MRPTNKSAIIVDIGSKLRLFNIIAGSDVKVTAFETADYTEGQRAAAIAEALKKFSQKYSLKNRQVIISTPLHSFFIRRLELPFMPEREIPQALRWQMKDDVPFDSARAIVDYKVIGKLTRRDGSKAFDMVCAIADYDVLFPLASAIQKAGFKLVSVGLLPFGYAYVLKQFNLCVPQKPCVVVHIGETSSLFAVYLQQELRFYRELPLSLESLRQSLYCVGIGPQGKDRLTTQEAEEVLFTIGIPTQTASYKNKMNSLQILSALRPFLERVVNEIKRSNTYYETQLREGKIEQITISGIGSCVAGLDTFLNQELGLKTTILNSMVHIDFGEKRECQSLGYVGGALGLLLSGQQGINFIPSRQKIASKAPFMLWFIFCAAVLGISAVAFSASLFSRLALATAQARTLSLRLSSLSAISVLQSQADSFEALVVTIKKNQYSASTLLKLFNDITSPELLLQELSFDQPTHTGKVKGVFTTQKNNQTFLLTEFMRRIEESGLCKEVSLDGVEKKQDAEQEVASFGMTLQLK